MSNPKPLQIYKLKNGKYEMDLPVFNSILDKVGDRRLAIYSINGPYRDGKSFLLGFFLRYLYNNENDEWLNQNLESTFKISSGCQRETEGIFMWSDPFTIKKNDGSEVALLLMDTQGTFDNKTTMQQNAIIFALSVLFSSFTIYNIKERLSEDKFQFLQYFLSFAKLADEENKDQPFQKLLFLIRDWHHSNDYDYGYYDDTHSINGKNYKKENLDVNESSVEEIKLVHELIYLFTQVSCYLMPDPGLEVYKNNFDLSKLQPDFLLHLREFVPFLLRSDEIVEKKIGGCYVTGKEFKIFVERWAIIFESNALPSAKTLLAAQAESQYEIAKSNAVDNYARKMKDVFDSEGMADEVFDDLHRQALDDSMKQFKNFRKLGESAYEDAYTVKTHDEIEVQRQYFKQFNHKNRIMKETEQKMLEEINSVRIQSEDNATKYANEVENIRHQLNAIQSELSSERNSDWKTKWVRFRDSVFN